jgi:antitoxin MazE
MLARVQKWGNSQGLRFPKAFLKEVRIGVGDAVTVSVRGRRIVVEPVERIRGRYELKKLAAGMPKSYRVKELHWGAAVGKEAW